jgi:hypothetical protein
VPASLPGLSAHVLQRLPFRSGLLKSARRGLGQTKMPSTSHGRFTTCGRRFGQGGENGIRTRDAGFPTYRISNPALSATQPSLRSAPVTVRARRPGGRAAPDYNPSFRQSQGLHRGVQSTVSPPLAWTQAAFDVRCLGWSPRGPAAVNRSTSGLLAPARHASDAAALQGGKAPSRGPSGMCRRSDCRIASTGGGRSDEF